MEIIIEKAKVEDAISLIMVQNISFEEDFKKYGECPSYQESQENMIDMIKNAIVYKIIDRNQIIGDIIVRKKTDNSYYLRTISIIPFYQNLGIGTKIIEFIEKDNPNARIWYLITPCENDRNKHFYEKQGYKESKKIYHSESLTFIEYKKEII